MRWLCAPRSSRLEALRPSMSGTRRQLAVRGARCECDLELCAVRVREPRRSVDRHGPAYRRVAPWRDRAQRGRTHAVRVRGVCVGVAVAADADSGGRGRGAAHSCCSQSSGCGGGAAAASCRPASVCPLSLWRRVDAGQNAHRECLLSKFSRALRVRCAVLCVVNEGSYA